MWQWWVSNGGITVCRVDDEEYPLIGSFLSFLAADLKRHPKAVKELSPNWPRGSRRLLPISLTMQMKQSKAKLRFEKEVKRWRPEDQRLGAFGMLIKSPPRQPELQRIRPRFCRHRRCAREREPAR